MPNQSTKREIILKAMILCFIPTEQGKQKACTRSLNVLFWTGSTKSFANKSGFPRNHTLKVNLSARWHKSKVSRRQKNSTFISKWMDQNFQEAGLAVSNRIQKFLKRQGLCRSKSHRERCNFPLQTMRQLQGSSRFFKTTSIGSREIYLLHVAHFSRYDPV